LHEHVDSNAYICGIAFIHGSKYVMIYDELLRIKSVIKNMIWNIK